MTDTDRYLRAAGPLAVVAAFGGIIGAVAVAPWFSWAGDALSNLGEAGYASRPLFNGGLILAGLLGVGFAGYLRTVTRNLVHRVAVGTHVVAMLGMGGVGVFPIPSPYHFPVAVTAYLGFMVTMALWGAGTVMAGDRRRGTVFVLGSLGHLGFWVVWSLSLIEWIPGLAIPETVGAAVYSAWVLAVSR